MFPCGSGVTFIFYTLFSLLNTKTITNRFFCIVLINRPILSRLLQCEFYLVITVSGGLDFGPENFLCRGT